MSGMEFFKPGDLDEAGAIKGEHPDAVAIAGGTDVMVELNFDRNRPAALLDLGGVGELAEHSREGDQVRLGAAVPYSRVIDELGRVLPGLAMASRTVGSPQIRNRATVGGNLGSGSPAGDTHPVLLACDAEVELGSVRGTRRVPIAEFYTGVRQTAVEADELITSVFLDAATGPQQFSKIGPRNAMVIAVCCLGLALHSDRHRAGVAIGSAAPTPRHAGDAEEFLAAELPWGTASPLGDKLPRRFGELVAAAAEPIDDVRGSADYRRHALSVLARRALGWAWHDYREGSYQECA